MSSRTIFRAAWEHEPTGLTLFIAGDGFLRGMVRGLVGTLLEVARGERTPAQFAALLSGGERGAAGPTAPAHGLALERVDYSATHAAAPARRGSADGPLL